VAEAENPTLGVYTDGCGLWGNGEASEGGRGEVEELWTSGRWIDDGVRMETGDEGD